MTLVVVAFSSVVMAGANPGSPESYIARLALDAEGNALVVFSRHVEGHRVLFASTRRSGRQEGSLPVILSEGQCDAIHPSVAVDASGKAIVTWTETSKRGSRIIKAATFQRGSGWSAPSSLSSDATISDDSHVACDRSGNAVVVWNAGLPGQPCLVQAAALGAGEASWITATDLSDVQQVSVAPRVAMDLAGNAVAVWRKCGDRGGVIQAATLTCGSAVWTSASDLSSEERDADEVNVVVGPGGTAMAVWVAGEGGHRVVQRALWEPGAREWSSPVDLSESCDEVCHLNAAVNAKGDALVSWTVVLGTRRMVAASSLRGPSFSRSDVAVLSSAAYQAEHPQVAVDSWGNSYAVWMATISPEVTVIQAATLAWEGKKWTAPIDLTSRSESCLFPQVRVDVSGNTVALWVKGIRYGYPPEQVQAAVFRSFPLFLVEDILDLYPILPLALSTSSRTPWLCVWT